MRPYKLVLLVSLVSAGPAFAADLSPQPVEPVAPVVASPFTWTGFYVGINAGYGGGTFKNPYHLSENGPGEVPLHTLISGKLSNTASGFVGGGQVGYNYQIGENFVLGAEADIQYSGIKSDAKLTGGIPGLGGSLEAETDLRWYGTARLRAGYALDRLLIYATGGVAYGDVKESLSYSIGNGNSGTGGSLSGSDNRVGWAAGGGLEYAITDHWTFKTEYLYVDLGKAKTINRNFDVGDDTTLGLGIKSDVAVHTVRAGLNYKF